MIDVMVDLEAFALDSNAAILSIGAVEFSADGLGEEFYVPVVRELQERKWKRVVEQRTLKWWDEQSEAARYVLHDPTAVHLDKALHRFAQWRGGKLTRVWGYGAHYDNVVLANAFEATGTPMPWSYQNNRCFRTLKALAPDMSLAVPQPKVEHNALDDARYQAQYAVLAIRHMRGELK